MKKLSIVFIVFIMGCSNMPFTQSTHCGDETITVRDYNKLIISLKSLKKTQCHKQEFNYVDLDQNQQATTYGNLRYCLINTYNGNVIAYDNSALLIRGSHLQSDVQYKLPKFLSSYYLVGNFQECLKANNNWAKEKPRNTAKNTQKFYLAAIHQKRIPYIPGLNTKASYKNYNEEKIKIKRLREKLCKN